MTTPIRNIESVIIQTSSDLSIDDEAWVTLPFCRHIMDSEGAGQITGDAEFDQQFGLVTVTNQYDPVYAIGTAPNVGTPGPDDSLIGQLIRLLVTDDDGDIFIGDVSYTAFWWGQAIGYTINPDGRPDDSAGGIARWRCAGLASVLDQITIFGGWVLAPSDSVDWIDPGFCPPFNAVATGDMSLNTYEVNGQQCNVHDLSTLTPVGTWQATQIVTLLLAGSAQVSYLDDTTAYNGFPWALSDPQSLLAYDVERTDLGGRTLAEALNLLINPRRGITWTVTVVDGVATVNVWSGTATDITVGAFTLPASTNTTGYVASGNLWTSNLIIDEDQLNTFDIIEIRGARPWVGITLVYDGSTGTTSSLIKGWDPAQEIGSGSYPPDGHPDGWNYFPSLQINEQIWRLFQINPGWDGSQYDDQSHGMRNILGKNGEGGGYDGSRSIDLSDVYNPPATLYGMERTTPASPGFGTSRLGPRQEPVIIAGNGTDENWYDCSNSINFAPGFDADDIDESVRGNRWGIDCIDNPPYIRVDDGQTGYDINNVLAATGGTLLVTVGMRETEPLKVSYIFDQGTWPRSTPRVKMIHVPDLEQWVILPNTVMGTDPDGNLVIAEDLITIRDDTAKANQLLALAVARYGYPIVTARWTERCLLDTDSQFAPGALINNITVGTGDVFVGSVITRRTHTRIVRDGVDMWDTTYETTRVTPDVEILL